MFKITILKINKIEKVIFEDFSVAMTSQINVNTYKSNRFCSISVANLPSDSVRRFCSISAANLLSYYVNKFC